MIHKIYKNTFIASGRNAESRNTFSGYKLNVDVFLDGGNTRFNEQAMRHAVVKKGYKQPWDTTNDDGDDDDGTGNDKSIGDVVGNKGEEPQNSGTERDRNVAEEEEDEEEKDAVVNIGKEMEFHAKKGVDDEEEGEDDHGVDKAKDVEEVGQKCAEEEEEEDEEAARKVVKGATGKAKKKRVTKTNNLRCVRCHEGFQTKKYLKQHVQRKSCPGKPSQGYQCYVCGDVGDVAWMKDHLFQAHADVYMAKFHQY